MTRKKILKKIIEAIGFITIDDYEVEVNEIRAILGDFKMYDYTLLENKFNPLLRLLSVILTDSELDECLLFVKAGEYGVAFEPLCVMLEETGKSFLNPCSRLFPNWGNTCK